MANTWRTLAARSEGAFTLQKGFLASLFDPSFSSLITTKVIKVIYILSMILIGLGALASSSPGSQTAWGWACSCW